MLKKSQYASKNNSYTYLYLICVTDQYREFFIFIYAQNLLSGFKKFVRNCDFWINDINKILINFDIRWQQCMSCDGAFFRIFYIINSKEKTLFKSFLSRISLVRYILYFEMKKLIILTAKEQNYDSKIKSTLLLWHESFFLAANQCSVRQIFLNVHACRDLSKCGRNITFLK